MKMSNERRWAVFVWLETWAGVGVCEHGNELTIFIKEILPTCECTIFAPIQHLRTRREQRPSNKTNLDSNAVGRLSILHVG
jgi:hypothetical protein